MNIEEGGGGTFWAVIIAAGTLVINIIVAILNGVSTLKHARDDTDQKLETKDRQLTEELIGLERRFKADIESSLRIVGETMTAFRQKITDVELWGRDHYVDKSTFQTFVTDWRRSWERFEEKLDARLDRLDKKLDDR